MSYYIRYVLADDRPVQLEELEAALRQVDPAYAIVGDLIKLKEVEYGLIGVTCRGDPVCDDDLDLLARLAERKKHRAAIMALLHEAKAMVCVQPMNSLDVSTDEVLAPLWNWQVANRVGLLAWEGGQFFNQAGELK